MKMGYKVSFVKCVHCGHVYVSVRPDVCLNENLECPACHKEGAAVMPDLLARKWAKDKKEPLRHLWN